MSASTSTRLNEALSLLVQSPPGQTSQVYHDLRGILFDAESNSTDKIDDSSLQSAAAVALEEYNTQQLVTATLPDDASAVIICQDGQVADASATEVGVKRYLHAKLKKTFLFDHVKRTVSDVKDAPESVDAEVEATRAALEHALESYVKDRYPDGVSSVFAVSSMPVKDQVEFNQHVGTAAVENAKSTVENTANASDHDGAAIAQDASNKDDDQAQVKADAVDAVATVDTVSSSALTSTSAAPQATSRVKTTFAIHHVGNRFNLSNFWSGRWRASYTLDAHSTPRTLTCSITVQVHYFENGNVQLNAAKPRTFHLSANDDNLVHQVVSVIGAHEDAWQHALEHTYDELAESAFKALRRQLPLTRQKVDWDKVLNYKLRDQLARA